MRFITGLCAAFAALLCHPALAQAPYPVKPIRMIVASVPGGANDTGARLTAPSLAEVLGQPVVVENRAASGGLVGIVQVAQAAPDALRPVAGFRFDHHDDRVSVQCDCEPLRAGALDG